MIVSYVCPYYDGEEKIKTDKYDSLTELKKRIAELSGIKPQTCGDAYYRDKELTACKACLEKFEPTVLGCLKLFGKTLLHSYLQGLKNQAALKKITNETQQKS